MRLISSSEACHRKLNVYFKKVRDLTYLFFVGLFRIVMGNLRLEVRQLPVLRVSPNSSYFVPNVNFESTRKRGRGQLGAKQVFPSFLTTKF